MLPQYLAAQELEPEPRTLRGHLTEDTHLLEHDAGKDTAIDLDDVDHEERYDEEDHEEPIPEHNNVIDKEYVEKLRQLHRNEVLINEGIEKDDVDNMFKRLKQGMNVENILPTRLRKRVRFNEITPPPLQ